ncbi:LGFP repeat-containing protein [Arthrobacter alpinus]|uniref:LGFP repeat-containing protein n=1 Tax=Arthrobacter alpinus TaxID=656366 RepID=A0A1H5PFQ6_9MICC|nr:GDSL-type esterase/lipase family protein [Arthrobacter alpinus]SEF11921.1 LGFP repeat-containing protein [Arthrobacter alpinus]
MKTLNVAASAMLAFSLLAGAAVVATDTAQAASSTQVPVVDGYTGSFYYSNLEARSALGQPKTNKTCPYPNGLLSCQQGFANGSIVWSQKTGAQYTTGAIDAAWAQVGGRTGYLGHSLQSPRSSTQNGVYQFFERGAIYWTAATGAQISYGGIRSTWGNLGFEKGALGYPLTNETVGYKTGGVYQRYQGGTIIWSERTGAHAMLPGDIAARYNELGGPDGILGYPTGEKYRINDGWGQAFANGRILWGPNIGAKVVDENTYRIWAGNPSQFGWPTTDNWAGADGIHTKFQKTETVWNQTTNRLYSAQVAGPNSVVMIGDSQLDGDSYTEQAARALGMTDQIQLAYGGMGYVASNPVAGGSGPFAIDSNHVLLPGGTPGLVIVNLGGNDARLNVPLPDVAKQATLMWKELRAKYPQSKIVVNGVMSRTDASHTQRRAVDQIIVQTATAQGIETISLAGMATKAGADGLYQDGVHLTQAGHNLLAKSYLTELSKHF